MVSLTIPKIFFNVWLWFAIIAVIIIIHYFWGKAPPPPKPSKFYNKHKKTIGRILDICLTSFVLLYCLIMMSFPVRSIINTLTMPHQFRAEIPRIAWEAFFFQITICSGMSGIFVGLLSVFQSNLTKVKRIILLIISLLPIAFTTLLLLIEPSAKHWSTIKLGLNCTAGCWIINGPAIIVGKHFVRVAWSALRILKLVSGDFPA